MDHFWLTDEQFARIAPLLPNDTRGKERLDDRRVISGIGLRAQIWRALDGRAARSLRAEEDPLQSLRALGGQGDLGRAVRDASPSWRAVLSGADRLHRREGSPLCRGGQTYGPPRPQVALDSLV